MNTQCHMTYDKNDTCKSIIYIVLEVLFFGWLSRYNFAELNECNVLQRIQQADQVPVTMEDSIFNCHSHNGKCKYFRPSHFFHHKCGLGYKYFHLLQEMDSLREKKLLWPMQPPIPLCYLSLTPDMMYLSDTTTTSPKHQINLTFIHIHKNGGSSLVQAFKDFQIANSDVMKVRHGMHVVYVQGGHSQSKWEESRNFLKGSVRYQHSSVWDMEQYSNHLTIAIVRDPVERFISAVGQVTSDHHKKKGFHVKLKDDCLTETYDATLWCFLRIIKKEGFGIDLHFTPQALELGFVTMHIDLPVAIFPFSVLGDVLESIGSKRDIKKKGEYCM